MFHIPTSKRETFGPKFTWQGGLTIMALVLARVAYLYDDIRLVTECFIVSAWLACWNIYNHKEWNSRRHLLYFIVIPIFSYASYRVYKNGIQREAVQHLGVLFPANDARPPNGCDIPEHKFALLYGNNVSTPIEFPHTVVRIDGNDLLSVGKKTDELLLNFRIFDDRGDIIARMSQSAEDVSTYWVRPDSRLERGENRNSLSVFDHRDNLVLDVEYLNPSTVKV